MPESPDDSDDPTRDTDDPTRDPDDPADGETSVDAGSERTPTVEDHDADAGPDAAPDEGGSAPAGPGGRSLAPDEQYCPSCGEPIKKAAEICPECGVRQQPPTSTGKDRVTAGILALLLGGIGAHKFYLGETGMGILYLCFSWTFIPALVGLIEGILYLTKTDAEFERKYVN